MKTTSLFLIALLATAAQAETYYVDATLGKDTHDGKSATVSGTTVGPWQTLGKISSAFLLPGDKVLLKCGEVWRESLRINSSGIPGMPVTLGSYPEACGAKPVIDGSAPIPASSWTYQSAGIYKAVFGKSQSFLNTFSGNLNGWTKWSPNQDGMLFMTSSCPEAYDTCLRFISGRGTGYNLVRSTNTSLQAGVGYQLSFSLKAPKGTIIRPALRSSTQPNEHVGLYGSVTGTGSWQTYKLPFTATATLSNARIEFEVPTAYVDTSLDNVRIDASVTVADVPGLFSDGKVVNIAHHPNRGYNPQRPTSLYLTIAENADRVTDSTGRTVSTYLTAGPDLQLPAGASLGANTGIRVRVNSWMIDDRKIASQSGARLYFDKPTSYPVEKDWGYYLYGQRWMLDEPGEWYFDSAAGELFVRMPDDQAPGERISIAQKEVGIDLNNRSHVTVEDIAIRNVNTGVDMRGTTNVTLRHLFISDTLSNGINALKSTDGTIQQCQLSSTSAESISAYDGPNSSTRLMIVANRISNSGVLEDQGRIYNLPANNQAAVLVNGDASIIGNTINKAAYIGIRSHERSTIANNYISNTCMVLDDCGAIYVNKLNNGSLIQNNIIQDVPGAPNGKPHSQATQGYGIMLDDLSSNVVVSGNTISNADVGILLHNAFNNKVENNIMYGNRLAQLWFQENTYVTTTTGDIYGNTVYGNQFFPLPGTSSPSMLLRSNIGSTDKFGDFNYNIYSTLIYPYMARVSSPSLDTMHNFKSWQLLTTAEGYPRRLDPDGKESTCSSYATYRIDGGNLINNGSLKNGTSGWAYWNLTPPFATWTFVSCPIGNCLKYTAGASVSLLNSPNFTVLKDQWYRITFDLKTATNNQPVNVVLRRGGGGSNGYEPLVNNDEIIYGTTEWKRYSHIVKSMKTVRANDPVTLDLGARIDFRNIMPGETIYVANLEIVPIGIATSSTNTLLLSNTSDQASDTECNPDGGSGTTCIDYVRFADCEPVAWPQHMPSMSSAILLAREASLLDSDSDGIADQQDQCQSSTAGLSVNALGCTIQQDSSL